MGLLSAGCLFWLEKLQPVFFAVALVSLAYQALIVWRRPPFLRPRAVKAILATSVAVNLLVLGTWTALWFRYQ